jgi:Zn finger protein HypA/HybF involved in hydrogenase expression
MRWPKVTAADAAEQMLANELRPLVPYPGSTQPWLSECLRCGKNVQPRLSKVRVRGHQCAYCSGQRIDESDAVNILAENSLTPLGPYPGASRKWAVHCDNCNHDIEVVLANVKLGRRCGYCAKRRVDVTGAEELMRERGLEPLVPYPGDKPWAARCIAGGHEVSPRLVAVRAGHGCSQCARESSRGTRLVVDEILQRLPEFHLKPLEPFTSYHTPWRCECTECNREVTPTWGHLMSGRNGCAYCSGKRVDPDEVAALLKSRLLIPLVPYPGANTPWACRCGTCGNEVRPRYADLKRQSGCVYCAGIATKPEDAVRKMQAVDLEPKAPYPGANKPWECQCLKCGNTVRPHYTSVQQGRRGCRFCAESGIDYTAPGYLYVITNPGQQAHKVGIANFAEAAYEDRVERHIRHGWEPYKATIFDSTETAFRTEQATLSWLRKTRRLPPKLGRAAMPQGGWTETVDATEIELETIWKQVLAFKRKLSVSI